MIPTSALHLPYDGSVCDFRYLKCFDIPWLECLSEMQCYTSFSVVAKQADLEK